MQYLTARVSREDRKILDDRRHLYDMEVEVVEGITTMEKQMLDRKGDIHVGTSDEDMSDSDGTLYLHVFLPIVLIVILWT